MSEKISYSPDLNQDNDHNLLSIGELISYMNNMNGLNITQTQDIYDYIKKLSSNGITNEEHKLILNKIISNKKCIADEANNKCIGLRNEISTNQLGVDKIKDFDKNIFSKSVNIIKILEGKCINVSKWDKGQFTRGYGTKAPGKGLRISEKKAIEELMSTVAIILKTLNKEKWFKEFNSNQKVALTSFFYNVGLTKKGKENLMYRLKNNFIKASGNMMFEYHNASGKPVKGLHNRRIIEVAMFDPQNFKNGYYSNLIKTIEKKFNGK